MLGPPLNVGFSSSFIPQYIGTTCLISIQLYCITMNLTAIKELLIEQNKNELKEISEYCEQIIKRYENFTSTTTSILASKDEWIDAQCIPDIRAASEPLIEEMKKEFPELESLSDFVISDITKVIIDDVTITEYEECVIDINGIKAIGWRIDGMTTMIVRGRL